MNELLLGALLTWPPAFLLGIWLGRYLERHKETSMNLAVRSRQFYDEWAPAFVVVVAVLALAGIWLGAAASFANKRQDEAAAARATERNAEIRGLLACFDDYAAASSQSTGAVRAAAVRVDRATTIRDDALNREGVAFKVLVSSLLDDANQRVVVAQFKRLQVTLEERADAARVLDRAQENLDEARSEYPVPPAPSKFCDVKP